MSYNNGPRTFNSGLIACYDTSNIKSYRGEPTTNYLPNALTPNSAVKESFSGTVTENSAVAPDGTMTAAVINCTAGYLYDTLTIPTGTTVTYSVWLKKLDGTSNVGPLLWNYNEPTYGIVAQDTSGVTTEWKRFSMTYTTQAWQSSFAISYASIGNGVWGTFAFWRPQLEYKSHATPFAVGTRSVTAGLVDLTRNYTFDLTNSTFDANAGLSFHEASGSRVVTNLPIYTGLPATSNFTFEVWVKITAYPSVVSPPNVHGSVTRAGVLIGATSYGGAAIYWYGNSSGNVFTVYGFIRGADSYRATSGYNLSLNQYYHLVQVHSFDEGKLKLYVNGSLYSEVAGAQQGYYYDAGNVGVGVTGIDGGGTQNYTSFNGVVDVAKIYNVALTSADILRNYAANKRRFGLS